MIADNIPNPCPLTLIADSTGKRTIDVRNIAKRLGCNVRGKEKTATVEKSDALRIINEIQAKKEKNIAKQLQNIQAEAISQLTNHKENVMQIGFLTLADIAKANNITNERAKEILDAENIKPALYPDEDTPVPLYKDKVCGRVERFLIAEAAAEQARKEAEEKAAEEERKRIEAEKAAEEERKRIEAEKAAEEERKQIEAEKEVAALADENVNSVKDGINEYMKKLSFNPLETEDIDRAYRKMLVSIGYRAMIEAENCGETDAVCGFREVPAWLAKAAKQRDTAVLAQVFAVNQTTLELMVTNKLLRELLNATKDNAEQTRRLADSFTK